MNSCNKDLCYVSFTFAFLIHLFIHRDAEDHIAWLLEHGCHEKALEAVEAGQGRSELLDEVPSFSSFGSSPPYRTLHFI